MDNNVDDKLYHSDIPFRSVFNQLPDMMWICMQDGRLVEINSAGVNLLAYDSRNDILARDFLQPLSEPQEFLDVAEIDGKTGFRA